MKTHATSGIFKANPRYALQIQAYLVLPNGFLEAVKDCRWKEAMDSKIQALQSNNTWMLVLGDPSMNVMTYKWVFLQKMNDIGNVECFKARLVENGMRQVNGIDVMETFALVIKPTSIKLILIFAITWGWELR